MRQKGISVQRKFDGPAGDHPVRGAPLAPERGAPAPGEFQNAVSFTAPAAGKRSHFHDANHEATPFIGTDAEQKLFNRNSFGIVDNCTG